MSPSSAADAMRDVMVEMRDGIRLATDVRGIGEQPRPVLMLRTPYGKTAMEALGAPFVAAGYVLVLQDCRGCFGSEGDLDFLWPEAEDGYDTCAWIVEQPWCDGRIATFGSSWAGWTQTALAALDPPGLTAMVPMQSGFHALETSVRHHGAVELRFVAWAFWHSAQNTRTADVHPLLDAAPRVSELFQHLPLRRGETQLRHVPAYERWALEIASSGDLNERWSHPSVSYREHVASAAHVPTLLVGGWYDSYTRAEFQLFASMRERGIPVRLLIGPWTHGAVTLEQSLAGDLDLGPAAVLNYHQLHLEHFDAVLRGKEQEQRAPIRIFVMGGGPATRTPQGRLLHGGSWRDEHEWPLARTSWTTLHLHGDGSLRDELSSGSTSFVVDPDDPVPTVGGNLSSLMDLLPPLPGTAPPIVQMERMRDLVPNGGWDQRDRNGRALADRDDVLVFQTAPLEYALEVTGPIIVRLWVSSDAVDTDVTAKLVDVFPDGYALNLTDSILRLRHRQGETTVPYVPGTVVPLELELYPTSNIFEAGHRIRLDISGSNFPRFDPNPGTGEALWAQTHRVRQTNTIWHDPDHPSHLLLPVIPSD